MDVTVTFSKRLPRFLLTLLLLILHVVHLLAINPANVRGATESKSESYFDGFLAAQRGDAELNDLFVLSPDHVWAVGERGTILFSEDGGRNWRIQESGTTCSLRGVYFLDSQRGWAVGFQLAPYSQRPHGIVLQTIDGGKRWQMIPQPFLPPLYGIQPNAQGNLITWGNWSSQLASSVFESFDGGKQWSPLPNLSSTFQKLAPLGTGNLGLDDQGQLWRWELQGAIGLWQRKDLPSRWSSFALNDDQLIAITEDGACYQGAPNRLPQPLTFSGHNFPLSSAHAIAARGARRWIAGSPGNVILRSEDAGTNWQAVSTNFTLPIKQLRFLDENRGWAIGELGNILATRDGGITWWLQRSSVKRVGVMAIVDHPSEVPWAVLGMSGCEYKRSTSIVYIPSVSPTNRYTSNYQLDRFSAATSAIGASDLTILHRVTNPSTNPSTGTDKLQATSRAIQNIIDNLHPEIIVIAISDPNDATDVKSAVLQAVSRGEGTLALSQTASSTTSSLLGVRKVFVKGTARQKSLDISGNQILRHSGKLLSDISNRASSLISDRSNNNYDCSLVLIYSDNPIESSAQNILSGMTPSDDATRTIELSHQSNLQIVLGAAARKKSLERLLEIDERRDPREEYWNEQFRSVCDTLPREEIDHALIGLADQLRRQGKWQKWQVVAETIIRRSPAGGPAEQMWRQLLSVASSDELNTWRKRQLQNKQNQIASSSVITASAQVRDTPPSSPFESKKQPSSDDALPLGEFPNSSTQTSSSTSSAVANLGTNDDLPTAALMRWLLDQLPQRNAELMSDPDLLMQISSWYARYPDSSQQRVDTVNGLLNLSRQPYLGFYQRAATLELAVTGGLPNNNSHQTKTTGPVIDLPFGRDYSFSILPTENRPLLDGYCNEDFWRSSYKVVLFDPLENANTFRTEAKIAYDAQWLYIHLHCDRHASSTLPERIAQREYDSDLSGQDRVRVLIDTDRDRETAFELEVDHRGLTRDSCWGLTSWNPQWFVAQQGDAERWMVEIAIPLAELSDRESITGARWCLGLERIIPQTSVQKWPAVSERTSAPFDLGIMTFTTAVSYQPQAEK
jgi:photosystem II stability/assembly factor-like uncharacterized protein